MSASLSTGVGSEIPYIGLAKTTTTTDVTAKASYNYDHNASNYNSNYASRHSPKPTSLIMTISSAGERKPWTFGVIVNWESKVKRSMGAGPTPTTTLFFPVQPCPFGHRV